MLPIRVMSSLMVYDFIHNQRQGKQIMLKLFLSQIMIFRNQDSSNELIDKGNYVKLQSSSLLNFKIRKYITTSENKNLTVNYFAALNSFHALYHFEIDKDSRNIIKNQRLK